MADSPAEELRAAARLMRERAEKATPGPWQSWIEGRDHWGGDSFIETGGEDLYPYVQVSAAHNPKYEENRDYIASMHPLIALALADWLDAEAGHAEQAGLALHSLSPGPLALARAYLGGDRG